MSWLLIWKDHKAIGSGTIVVIDIKTLSVTRLSLRNFTGPFNTHGIDIISDSNDSNSIYIVAVNHLPNPDYYGSPTPLKDSTIPKARSRLEIFHHRLNSQEATHLRSIWHPLLRTPNDAFLKSVTEIYVTNDHRHREGPSRLLEEVAYGSMGQPTDLVHIQLDTQPHLTTLVTNDHDDDTAGVTAKVANIIDMNNGIGHGKTPSEIMIVRASSGQLLLGHVDGVEPPKVDIDEIIQLDSTLDTPSYFSDPYAVETGRDASGYVVAGLARAITFPVAGRAIPVTIWLAQPNQGLESARREGHVDKWTRKVIFQDDGQTVRTASTAVMVAIDPSVNDGKKQAHLFITGPLSEGVVVAKVDI
ncbi:hypothetical protein SLS63_004940 [Diaporthe eres]|uniref:Serum paraoxonase/arylesterase n=1 Tax=Diaporthe eres TaxID=83184 RepID=A0ABR1PCK5_DIAER